MNQAEVVVADSPSSQQIGDVAEDALRTWCSEVPGLVSNKSDRDRTGWDYQLDLASPDEPTNRDLAARPSALYCKLQVKGTIGSAESVPIKLSNLERMAKDPMPWFLILVVVSSQAPIRAVRSYWVHISQELVARVLEGLRSTDKPLNQVELSIKVGEQDELLPLGGAEIVSRIRSAVGTLEDYVARKVQWARTALARLDSVTYELSFYYKTEARLFAALAALAIDELPHIPLRSLSAQGHVLKKARASGASITGSALTVSNHSVSPSTVALRSPAGATELVCETRVAQRVFPFLPASYNRFKLRSRFADLIIAPSSTHATIRLRLDQLVGVESLDDLWRVGDAFRILASSDCEIEIRGNSKSVVLRPDSPAELDHYTASLVVSIASAVWLAQNYGLTPSALRVDISRLISSVHRLMMLRYMLDSEMSAHEFSIRTTEQVVDGTTGALVVVQAVELGEYMLLATAAVVGSLHLHPSESGGVSASIASPKPRKLQKRLLTLAQWRQSATSPAEEMLDEAVSLLHNEGILITITGDPAFEPRIQR